MRWSFSKKVCCRRMVCSNHCGNGCWGCAIMAAAQKDLPLLCNHCFPSLTKMWSWGWESCWTNLFPAMMGATAPAFTEAQTSLSQKRTRWTIFLCGDGTSALCDRCRTSTSSTAFRLRRSIHQSVKPWLILPSISMLTSLAMSGSWCMGHKSLNLREPLPQKALTIGSLEMAMAFMEREPTSQPRPARALSMPLKMDGRAKHRHRWWGPCSLPVWQSEILTTRHADVQTCHVPCQKAAFFAHWSNRFCIDFACHCEKCKARCGLSILVSNSHVLSRFSTKEQSNQGPPEKNGVLADSIIARPGIPNGQPGGVQSHMEVVTFDPAQAYPEFIVRFTEEWAQGTWNRLRRKSKHSIDVLSASQLNPRRQIAGGP